MHDISEFMTSYHMYNTYKWKIEWEKWEDIVRSLLLAKRHIMDYITDYSWKMEEQIEKDLGDLPKKEKNDIIDNKYFKFIDLLMQNIEPVWFRKPRPKKEPK